MKIHNIEQGDLKSILNYNPESGVFRWINPSKYHPRLKGKVAGCASTGYLVIKIKKNYKAHKLAWLYIYGEWPSFELDHKDGNPLNNKIANLRKCTNSQNQANKKRKSGKVLPKGVRATRNRFTARISHNKQLITIGTFNTVEEATSAYFEKAREFYGTFARRD